ncbi:MAG: hypothetical protein M3H12_18800 [Chromatiales bacterium]
MGQLYTTDFTNHTLADLTAHADFTGINEGASPANYQVDLLNDQAYCNGLADVNTGCAYIDAAGTIIADGEIEASVVLSAEGEWSGIGRCDVAATHFEGYALYIVGSSGGLVQKAYLYKRTGSWTNYLNAQLIAGRQSGDTISVKLKAEVLTAPDRVELTATIDGVEYGPYTDDAADRFDAASGWGPATGTGLNDGDQGFLFNSLTLSDIAQTATELTGAALSVTTANGTLTTSIPLTGTASALAISNGDLTTEITLTGAALAQAIAQAGLTTAIPLSGAAQSDAQGSGDLDTGSALSGDATAQASATGDLTVHIQLSGDAIAQAAASGDLGADPSSLTGDALAIAQAGGDLTTQIPVTGVAVSTADASGNLTTSIPLSGVAASVTDAAGTLDLAVTLSGDAIAQAVATGSLTTQISLAGSAVAQALATGQLSTGAYQHPPAERLAMVWPETRTHSVRTEQRVMDA